MIESSKGFRIGKVSRHIYALFLEGRWRDGGRIGLVKREVRKLFHDNNLGKTRGHYSTHEDGVTKLGYIRRADCVRPVKKGKGGIWDGFRLRLGPAGG